MNSNSSHVTVLSEVHPGTCVDVRRCRLADASVLPRSEKMKAAGVPTVRSVVLFLGLSMLTSAAPGEDFNAMKAEKVAGGFQFTEGPVWNRAGYLLFCDIPANILYKWIPAAEKAETGAKEVFRQPSGKANGLTYDRKGRLIACEPANRRVSRTETNGTIVAIAETYQGESLKSPNDVVARRDGTIYFTDPPHVPHGEKREFKSERVFRISPEHELSVLVNDFDRPNGIALSPDEKTLYVSDTARKHVRAFVLRRDGSAGDGRVFAELKSDQPVGPDGMKVDVKGNLYVAGPGGVWVFDKAGQHLGTIPVPETPANCAFGDRDFKTLYITACTSIYKVRLPYAGYGTYRVR
jgi:gluconolactonase